MSNNREKCISCRKEMGEELKKRYLDYRNSEWRIARNQVCKDACNWCYWYAWDNASRVSTFQNLERRVELN